MGCGNHVISRSDASNYFLHQVNGTSMILPFTDRLASLTVKTSFKYHHLFFHFGTFTDSGEEGVPLVCLNGGIMADTGSEALDYIFTCQDRYPPYAAFGGMRCLLFVRDDAHRQQYRARLASLREHLLLIRSVTGPLLDIELPEPLYMPCSLTPAPGEQAFPNTETAAFREQIRDPLVINDHVLSGLYLNQLSPTIAKLVRQFYDLLTASGINNNARLLDYEAQAKIALKWHDKANYVNLVHNYSTSEQLPLHVPTALLSSRQLQGMTWARLLEIVRQQTRLEDGTEFFIKSAMDAGGELNVIVNKENLAGKINELTNALEIKVNKKGRIQHEVMLLVQPRIKRSNNEDMLPASVGLTYQIYDADNIERIVVIGQVCDDAERKTFIGSYLSDELTRNVLDQVDEEQVVCLLRLIAEQGYRGPINLDAVRNSQGQYIFIYDCNPRLGGSFPGLILRHALRRAGLRAETLLNIGYCGRFVYPDLKAKLMELQDLGLLYTQTQQRGVYLVPSFVRPNSFDPVLINMKLEEMREIISSGLLSSLSDPDQLDLKGVYW
jgi:hypothetical protein